MDLSHIEALVREYGKHPAQLGLEAALLSAIRELARERDEALARYESLSHLFNQPCAQYTDGVHRGQYPDGICSCGYDARKHESCYP